MDTALLVTLFLLVVAYLLLIAFRHKKMKVGIPSDTPIETMNDSNDTPESVPQSEFGLDLELFDGNGVKVLESREIDKIPSRAHRVESSSSAIMRVRHMAADLFKGAASTPNKTVEVIFKPEIHQGLADGSFTLMRTKRGEVLADAVDSSNKIVGKGRLIQGGKARQLAGGAFQLVSIAVAQSHLADIERNLTAIRDSISEVIERQENEDKARITGAFDYLREISTHMKELRCPDELAQQKRNAIEGIIRDSYSWRNKLEEDMTSLTKQISNLSNLDRFGTGDTFERLKSLIEKIDPLLKRRKLFLDLASAINFVTLYLDPAQREFSRIDVNDVRWKDLTDDYKWAVSEKVSKHIEKAFWNSSDTLKTRSDNLRMKATAFHRLANDDQIAYLTLRNSLDKSISSLIDSDGNMRIAMSFDNNGEVGVAAIL